MPDEHIGRHEYAADKLGHDREHGVIASRLTLLEQDMIATREVQRAQLSEMKDIKWLLIFLICGNLPKLVLFVKGLMP